MNLKATRCKSGQTRPGRTCRLLAVGAAVAAFTIAPTQGWGAMAGAAKGVTYPPPPGGVLPPEYQGEGAGRQFDLYMARVLDPPFAGKEWDYGGSYSFAN